MIDAPKRDELAATAAAMASGLHTDPGWRALVADDAARRLALRTLLGQALRVGYIDGTALVARAPGIVGGIVWAAPGEYPRRWTRQLLGLPRMVGLAMRIGPAALRELGRFGQAIDAAFPDEPVWYVQALGVAPEAQRQGLGVRLLQAVLTKSDTTSTPCYLETAKPDNVGYYQRFGFELVEAAPIYEGGPTMWRMRRPCKASLT